MNLSITDFSKIYNLCHEHQAKIYDKDKLHPENQMALELFYKFRGYIHSFERAKIFELSNELIFKIFLAKDVEELKRILSKTKNDWEFPTLIGGSYNEVLHIILSIEAMVIGENTL